MDIKLKPCPFCGSEVLIFTSEDNTDDKQYAEGEYAIVECFMCGARGGRVRITYDGMVGLTTIQASEIAARLWNTRTLHTEVKDICKEEK